MQGSRRFRHRKQGNSESLFVQKNFVAGGKLIC